jgi:hypothetical protein
LLSPAREFRHAVPFPKKTERSVTSLNKDASAEAWDIQCRVPVCINEVLLTTRLRAEADDIRGCHGTLHASICVLRNPYDKLNTYGKSGKSQTACGISKRPPA